MSATQSYLPQLTNATRGVRFGYCFAVTAFFCAVIAPEQAGASDFFWKVEKERVEDAIRQGKYDEALRYAEDFHKEYRKSWTSASQLERNGAKGRFQFYKAIVDFTLAEANRYTGRYDAAKSGYKAAEKAFKDLMNKEFIQYVTANNYKGTFEQIFLAAWDQGTIRGMYNAAQGLNAADGGMNQSMQNMLMLVDLRARLFDCYGSMEMDNGDLDAAERIFNQGLDVRESIGGERLDRVVEPHNRVYGTVSRNFGRLFLKRGEKLYEAREFDAALSHLSRSEHYFQKARKLFDFDDLKIKESEADSSSSNSDVGKQLRQQLKWMGMRVADLNFNEAELAMAMAVYDAEQSSGEKAGEFLEQADQLLSEASDTVAEFLETRDHPYLIYCWANIAGTAARRAVLLGESCDQEAVEYLEKAEELMAKRSIPADSPEAKAVARERQWVERAKKLDAARISK